MDNKIDISISATFKERCPQFAGAALVADVVNSESAPALWADIDLFIADYRTRYTVDSLKLMPPIMATREAYRRCGKDPSRYRPSQEALVRRTLKGHPLYRVSTLVDLLNLASIAYGYSIGGFDIDKIQGSSLELGIGRPDEPYEGIGRGPLNIDGLPVYRDAIGGIGTPTSDHERTKLSLGTRRLLAIINGYDADTANVSACAAFIQELLRKHAQSDGGSLFVFHT